MNAPGSVLKRRDLLRLSAAGLVSGVSVPWFEARYDFVLQPAG